MNNPTTQNSLEALNTLDTQNRERALALNSFIVEAPAGAGKTELLTQRYLKLLSTVESPEEIIALTFTNKAAAEMRNRILTSLENAQKNTPETAPHKLQTRALAKAALVRSDALDWHILAQPSRLRILTLDALCSSLTRQMPLLSAFGGTPAVSDDTKSHYLEAAQRAVAAIRLEPEYESLQSPLTQSSTAPIATVLQFLDNDTDKLTTLLAAMLEKRDQWLPYAGNLTAFDRHILADEDAFQDDGLLDDALDDEAADMQSALPVSLFEMHATVALNHLIEAQLQKTLSIITPAFQQTLMPLARHAIENLRIAEAEGGAKMLAKLAALEDWQMPLLADVGSLSAWQALANFALTGGGTYKKAPNKNDGFPANDISKPLKQSLIETLRALDEIDHDAQLAAVLALPNINALAQSQPVIRALGLLLLQATSQLWDVFQAAGEVDFIAIAHRALQALENEYGVTDLALALDYQLSHLLIDEFQDTNPLQLQLIEKLIAGWQPDDGRTLFCVGDPMQSIYRFRKAEVSIFLQASQQGIGDVPLTPLQLSRNNRSQPAVVHWINQAFARVFPAADAIDQGAIRYRPFTATRAAEPDDGVEIHPIVLPNAANGADLAEDDLQIDNVKTKTNTLLSDDTVDEINTKQLEAEYVAKLIQRADAQSPASHRIAVLVRGRAHLKELVSELRRHYPAIIFQAIEIERLSHQQSIQDVLSLTYALHHLADRVHWLNVLRAPWCGLILADLHDLAGQDHTASIWSLMQTPHIVQTLTPDGQQRIAHINSVLTAAFANMGRMPVRRLVQGVWLQLGGAACLHEASEHLDIDAFFDLIEKLSQRGYLSFSALNTQMQSLYAAPDARANGRIQLLTIHKSKGLEFETVIVPALNRKPRNEDAQLVLWQEVNVGRARHLIAAPVTKADTGAPASVYAFLNKLEETRRDHETTRLMYVAATRAINKLHLIATVRQSTKGELSATKKSLLAVLWPELEAQFLAAKPEKPAAAMLQEGIGNVTKTPYNQFVPMLQRLDLQTIQQLHAHTQSLPLASAFDGNAELQNKSLNAQYAALDIYKSSGILAHAYLAMMADTGAQNWTEVRLNECLPAMTHWLLQQGFAMAIAKPSAQKVLLALSITLNSAEGQWVLSSHAEAASELELMQLDHTHELRKHVIDRTFVHDNTRWIIDYKLADGLQEGDLITEAMRHQPQLKRYANLFKNTALPIKTAVFFISVGRLLEINM